MPVTRTITRHRRGFAPDPRVNRTLNHSIYDGMAVSAMAGGGETYFTAFALFLRVTAGQVAILSTLPPLIGSLAQLLSVWLELRLRHRKRVILAGAIFQAVIWLPLLLLAALPLHRNAPPSLVITAFPRFC